MNFLIEVLRNKKWKIIICILIFTTIVIICIFSYQYIKKTNANKICNSFSSDNEKYVSVKKSDIKNNNIDFCLGAVDYDEG